MALYFLSLTSAIIGLDDSYGNKRWSFGVKIPLLPCASYDFSLYINSFPQQGLSQYYIFNCIVPDSMALINVSGAEVASKIPRDSSVSAMPRPMNRSPVTCKDTNEGFFEQ